MKVNIVKKFIKQEGSHCACLMLWQVDKIFHHHGNDCEYTLTYAVCANETYKIDVVNRKAKSDDTAAELKTFYTKYNFGYWL